ncbi:tetratricopeptide repeat protein, partial [Ameyamaea chiangmaiensis]
VRADAPAAVGPEAGPDNRAVKVGPGATRRKDERPAAEGDGAALSADPGNQVLRHGAFYHALLAGSADLAERADPQGSGLAAYVRGNAALRAGQWASARAAYDSAPADRVGALLRPLLVAWTLAGAGQTDQALAMLGAGGGFFMVEERGLIAMMAGRDAQAGEALRAASAMEHGGDLLMALAYGHWLQRHGQIAQARALVHRAVSDAPAMALAESTLDAGLARPLVSSAREGAALDYVLAAIVASEQLTLLAGQPDTVTHQVRDLERVLLRLALQLQPDQPMARLLLAEILQANQQFDAARAVIGRIDPSAPMAPLLRYRLVLIEAASGRIDEARRELGALLRAQPDQPALLRLMGDLLASSGHPSEAVRVYDRLLAASGAPDWSLLLSRAMARDQSGDWTGARGDLERAVVLAPDQPDLLNYLGYSLVQRHEDLPRARTLLVHALDLAPHDAAIRDSVGWAVFRDGDPVTALGYLQAAAEKTPLDPAVNYHLGEVYLALGRRPEAIDEFDRALHLNPEPSDRQAIRRALDRLGPAVAGRTPSVPR